MTRTNATGLEEKEVREGVLLLVLLVLEAIVQALLGSEVTRTPESFHWFNLKNTPIVNMPIRVRSFNFVSTDSKTIFRWVQK